MKTLSVCSEIPRELLQAARGSEVHVSIEDNRQQEYVKPKLKVAAFSGHGRMLGRYNFFSFRIMESFHVNLA